MIDILISAALAVLCVSVFLWSLSVQDCHRKIHDLQEMHRKDKP